MVVGLEGAANLKRKLLTDRGGGGGHGGGWGREVADGEKTGANNDM